MRAAPGGSPGGLARPASAGRFRSDMSNTALFLSGISQFAEEQVCTLAHTRGSCTLSVSSNGGRCRFVGFSLTATHEYICVSLHGIVS